ncbi:MAG TPA: glycosyltransferase family 4 protein [Chloroflexota bacterium]|jgi:phosphatidylinositol alpha-mannosyltransferase|nr:glycosyltransferase family 4 protein [Chloroflexota bacterium]
MKIGLVSPYDYSAAGGVQEHVAQLDAQFRSMGHDVVVLTPNSRDGREEHHDNVISLGRVTPLRINGSTARITLSMWLTHRVRQILREEQFDVLHIHEPLMPALPLTVLRCSETVNIATFHAHGQSYASNLGYLVGKRIVRNRVRKLDGRIAVSNTARQFVEKYFPGDYTVIPNGINLEWWQRPAKPIERFADGRPNVLFLGRLENRKGLKYLIRAFQQVRQEVPGARLIVAGEGRLRAGFERYVWRHDLEADVFFTGFVPAEERPRYFATADVYCAPSTGQESFGIVLLEAMASGKAIVASNIDGYREVVSNRREGLLVPVRDADGIAEGLIELLTHADRREEMAQQGLRTVQQYSWSRVAGFILDYVNEVRRQRTRTIPLPSQWERLGEGSH